MSTIHVPDLSLSDKLCQEIVSLLDERKASDIIVIPLLTSALADSIIIASGNVARHVQSLADEARIMIKAKHKIIPSVEGYHNGDWVLIDAKDVIVHLFRPEVREYYDLEGIWQNTVKTPTPPEQIEAT